MKNKKLLFDISSAGLHILAMLFMLCDHLWATVFLSHRWLTCIGRISFPIFAFLIVEGYFHTKDLKKYFLRLLIFAIISEVPFDLMYSGIPFSIFHQNVLWTYLIALGGIYLIDKVKKQGKLGKTIFTSIGVVLLSFLLGTIGMTDFFGPGVWMVYVFYFFHERNWISFIGQILLMYWINVELSGGFYYPIKVFGYNLEIIEQGLAMLSLIPIWLYRGRQGYHSTWFKYFCYAFYPVHLLILGIIQLV